MEKIWKIPNHKRDMAKRWCIWQIPSCNIHFGQKIGALFFNVDELGFVLKNGKYSRHAELLCQQEAIFDALRSNNDKTSDSEHCPVWNHVVLTSCCGSVSKTIDLQIYWVHAEDPCVFHVQIIEWVACHIPVCLKKARRKWGHENCTRSSRECFSAIKNNLDWIPGYHAIRMGMSAGWTPLFCCLQGRELVTSVNTHLSTPKNPKRTPQSTDRVRALHALATQLATAAIAASQMV